MFCLSLCLLSVLHYSSSLSPIYAFPRYFGLIFPSFSLFLTLPAPSLPSFLHLPSLPFTLAFSFLAVPSTTTPLCSSPLHFSSRSQFFLYSFTSYPRSFFLLLLAPPTHLLGTFLCRACISCVLFPPSPTFTQIYFPQLLCPLLRPLPTASPHTPVLTPLPQTASHLQEKATWSKLEARSMNNG